MIIVVIAESSGEAARARLATLEGGPFKGRVMAELRVDALDEPEAVEDLLRTPVPVLVTCRRLRDGGRWRGTEDDRRRVLEQAMGWGAWGIDVEVDVLPELPFARGERVVASFHEFNSTPAELDEILATAFDAGVGRAKLVTRVRDLTDVLRLRRAVKRAQHPDRVVAFGLGPVGVPTRLLFHRMGASWVYAQASGPEAASLAPGLPRLQELTDLYYPDPSLPEPVAVFGVLGDRAEDSIGSLVFNRLFRERRMPAVYVPISSPGVVGLREALRLFGVRGLSVTIPHKEAVLPLADQVHDLARRIGAANTLVYDEGQLRAFNTDYHGVMEPIGAVRKTTDLRDRRALILGAGGAARAAAAALSDMGFSTLIHARTPERAQAAARSLGVEAGPLPTSPPAVIVNGTPVGGPRDPEGIPVPGELLGTGQLVMDMNYLPRRTALLTAAEAAGATVIEGAAMYTVQARHQLHHFWAGLPDVSEQLKEAVHWAMAQRASS